MPTVVPRGATLRLGEFIGEVTFLAADPPRQSGFALWRPVPGFAPRSEVDLVTGSRNGIRLEKVAVAVAPVSSAIPWLAGGRRHGTRSLLAWRAVVRAGLALVARGLLRPSISPGGCDAWAVGPLGEEDQALLEQLAAALPAEAHAQPIDGDPCRIMSPVAAVRACWDAVADALPRTAGAAVAFGGPLYAEWEPHPAGHLASFFIEGMGTEGSALQVGLDLPAGCPPRLVAGPMSCEGLVALHRGARRWPPLRRLISTRTADLSEAEADQLVQREPELTSVGLEIVVPDVPRARLEAVVGSETQQGDAAFTLDALLEFRWEVAAGDVRLTASEVEQLASSQRLLVRWRDRWLRVDPDEIRLIRRRGVRHLGAGEALAAAVTGTLEIDGRPVTVRTAGQWEALRARLDGLGGLREEPDPAGLAATLRGYQRRGLAWLHDVCELGVGGCLADDMGLGKTIQVIALHLRRAAGPVLVVCPASLLGSWEHELRTFAPGLAVRRYHGGGRGLDAIGDREVVLTTYGMVRRDRSRLADVTWDIVVADEAQQVKNPDSASARELRQVPARARVALTGTPVENRLLDLWSILEWTTPGLLGPRERFQARAAAVERGDDEEADASLRRLLRPFLLRRRKSDPGVAPELPAKTETDHLVALTQEQIGLYEAIVQETMEEVHRSEGIRRRGLVLKLITALKQVCNHPAQFLRQTEPLAGRSGKLEALDDVLDVILDEGESTLVFTQYVAMGGLIERHLAGRCAVEFLHGRVSVGRRQQMVERFQGGELPVLLISLRAGGFGLNLARATHVIHFDRWWNPAAEDQATDRAHRIGQERPVQVHRLITEGTIEERIAALLARKRGLAERVTGGGEAWISELADQELRDLVELRTGA